MSRLVSHQTLRRMAYFAAVAEAGSLRGAARNLDLSVPVLSTALVELEEELGLSLATRSTRRFELTEEGRQVRDHAQAMLAEVDAARHLSQSFQVLSGRLRLALPSELVLLWAPHLMRRMRQSHPKVEVILTLSQFGPQSLSQSLPQSYPSHADPMRIAAPHHPRDIIIQPLSAPPPPSGFVQVQSLTLPRACLFASKAQLQFRDRHFKAPMDLLSLEPGQTILQGQDRTTGQDCRLEFSGNLTPPCQASLIDWLRQGLGAALLPYQDSQADLHSIAAMIDFGQADYGIWQRNRHLPAEAAAFLELCLTDGGCRDDPRPDSTGLPRDA
ncbi:MAG: LysR family transcriptional regulator [Mangrovicoccus sp.]